MSGTAEAFSMPMTEALEYFRQKVRVPTRTWTDIWQGAHARAFAVAGVQRDDLLAGIKAALDKAIAQGTTLEEFRRDLGPLMDGLGWRARGRAYEGWRTRLVYQANLNAAYAAGRYAQMTEPETLEALPFWAYRHSRKRDPRPEHLAWDGKVLAADDAWWRTHYPPNGWGCGCWAEPLSRRQMRALGKEGPDPSPEVETRPWVDPNTGERRDVPKGIDPGWAHNHGQGWLEGVVPRELQEPLRPYAGNGNQPSGQRPASLPPMPSPPADAAPPVLPEGRDPGFYATRFLEVFGATLDRPALLRDVTGTSLTLSRHLFENVGGGWKPDITDRGRYFLRVAEALKNPDEVWLDWAETTKGGLHLRRRYLRRFRDVRGGGLAVFEWTSAGWFGTTPIIARAAVYLEKQRSGVLLYRRRDGEGEPPPAGSPSADAL